ncbi:polysaccharide deacetylase family protein [Yersinia ruckeri]|uniref:Outer membrane N-deacetylase n=1 Tax=Yersinia ruckeri TaxID=29486 RepID=A0A0A8VDS3_YERRU|nr:polysaccharide deacetylase family protein [Yersinia ruckeri]EKN4199873.1 polysaccharide deacetylase family protein [Yersinia ruckeri]EKN4206470.1 polysaccharide deacetylase family protein [Yersinia ruckeri]EKN4689926.1 polysaccharide deacetylase family protein [Yersinia ruckeri]EKN4700433.1 polysaccharide deacetylase family protein [Yersinia ruckeri]EKN4703841.1 polysaccharide deacetylase family protein [Yersinia ruckeri]
MNKLTVVMYHYVRNIKESRYPDIKGLELDCFIEQLDFFIDNYHIVTMEEVISSYAGKTELLSNSLLLTFDDGYAEHFNHVYPILKERGVQGSFFVPAKAILEHQLLDVNKIHFILASISNIDDMLCDIRNDINYYKEEYNLHSFDEYFSELAIPNRFDTKEIIFVKRILQHALPEKLRNLLSAKYFKKYLGIPEVVFAKELYMSQEQLKQLVRDGMHVGCHGYDHYWWNKLDQESLKVELEKSKGFLKSLGCDMSKWTACYPYGSSSDLVVAELNSQGCNLAFTTVVKLADIDYNSKLLIPRLDTNDFPPKSDNYKCYRT